MNPWPGWKRLKKKYGNHEVTDLCSYGFSHRSKLERAVCDQIADLEKAGELRHLAHEDTQYLSRARYKYIPDFKVESLKTGEIYWIEAKGKGDHRWPTTKRMWRFYGPGRLEIYTGKWQSPALIQTIVPEPGAKEEEACPA